MYSSLMSAKFFSRWATTDDTTLSLYATRDLEGSAGGLPGGGLGEVQKGSVRRPCRENIVGAGRSALAGVVVIRRPDSTSVAEGGRGGLIEEVKRTEVKRREVKRTGAGPTGAEVMMLRTEGRRRREREENMRGEVGGKVSGRRSGKTCRCVCLRRRDGLGSMLNPADG
jgi:hypothetical protein